MGSDEQLFGSSVQEAKPKIQFQFYTSPLAFYIDDLFFSSIQFVNGNSNISQFPTRQHLALIDQLASTAFS